MLRHIPSLNWLRVFEAAARTESFTGASRILNMSPSAVSQQIKALEGHLATDLFYRGARNVTLTEAGQSFLPVVRQALLSVETTAASLFGQPKEVALEVQAVLIFATSWLAPRLPSFERENPGIQLHITCDYRETDALKGGAELRIVFGGVPHSWGESDRLFSETIYPVAVPEIAEADRNRGGSAGLPDDRGCLAPVRLDQFSRNGRRAGYRGRHLQLCRQQRDFARHGGVRLWHCPGPGAGNRRENKGSRAGSLSAGQADAEHRGLSSGVPECGVVVPGSAAIPLVAAGGSRRNKMMGVHQKRGRVLDAARSLGRKRLKEDA